jgi:hypothetical protein
MAEIKALFDSLKSLSQDEAKALSETFRAQKSAAEAQVAKPPRAEDAPSNDDKTNTNA